MSLRGHSPLIGSEHVLKKLLWLGASPDRIITDVNESPKFGIVEIKCPYSKRDVTVSEACEDNSFYCSMIDGNPKLKENSEYHYQVQGQMALTGASWCDFVVMTKKSISIERIRFNVAIWDVMCQIINNFYFSHYLKYAATKSIANN